jgi:hypothetical protein
MILSLKHTFCESKDHLTEILRQGAQGLILQAFEAEFAAFLETHSDEKLEDGRKRVVPGIYPRGRW